MIPTKFYFPVNLALAAIVLPANFTLAAGVPTTQPVAPASSAVQIRARDYQHMLDELQLTIPGPLPAMSDDPNRPSGAHQGANGRWVDAAGNQMSRSAWGSWSNYDETKASPYPLPDALLLKNGGRVTDAQMWWTQRRPEIFADFQNEVYGKIPANTPAVNWEVKPGAPALGGSATMKSVIGHIDNSAYPAAAPVIRLTIYLPAGATGPVPLMVVVSPGSTTGTGRGTGAAPEVLREVLAAGMGYAMFDTAALQPDSGSELAHGIIGLMSKGQFRKPDDWGVLAAWSWGLSRAIDYLQTDPSIDATRLGIEGHSRWGKAALVAAAYDPRWAICFASCSGEGGAKPSRRNWGETLDNVAGTGEYYWMAGNFIKYGGHWNNLPVDSNELLALIAPRPVFVTGGTLDRWADPHGEFLAAVAAAPVYKVLGKADLGTTQMPAPDVELISGDIAFRYHEGPHTDTLDWPTFLKFARREFKMDAMGQ